MTKIILGNHCTSFRTPLINHISYDYKLQKSLAQWLKPKTIPCYFLFRSRPRQIISSVFLHHCQNVAFIFKFTRKLPYSKKKPTTASVFSEECRNTKCSSLGETLFSQFPPQDSLATSQQPELNPIASRICDGAWQSNNFSWVC